MRSEIFAASIATLGVVSYYVVAVREIRRHVERAEPVFEIRDSVVNIAVFAVAVLVSRGVFAALGPSSGDRASSLFEPSPLAWVAVVVVGDFYYYVKHRLMHRIRWLWNVHCIHHSSRRLNVTTALRFDWLGEPLNLPLIVAGQLLGIPSPVMIASYAVGLSLQLWAHTETVGRLPLLDGWLNTPGNHRRHHGLDASGVGCNFGGIFIVWDRLFGTYLPPSDQTLRYGARGIEPSGNPLRVMLGGWASSWSGKSGSCAISHERERAGRHEQEGQDLVH